MREFKLKDYKLMDTIAAIATFPSKSALGIIKISGKKSISIVSKIFKPAKKKNIKKVKTFTLHYGWIKEAQSAKGKVQSELIDEVLVSVMRKPNSYTKEDVVEISSHGGPAVLNKILELVLKEGARLALAGEFTYRAFIGGRIDLLQAESVQAIIEAKTDKALALAASQLKGEASGEIIELKEEIKDLFVETESSINFPEEDSGISFSQLKKKVSKIEKKIDNLIKAHQEAKIIHEGLRCVICGKANAGKSTLFNYLLGQERVLVSEISGTTRDVIEEAINIRGVPLRIYDTAGILEPKDLISKKALEKTHETFKESDLVILVLDASMPLERPDFFLLEKVENKNTILVINKIDLKKRISLKKLSKIKGSKVFLSALKKTGLANLEKEICKSVYKGGVARENVIFLSQYQKNILGIVKNNINQIKLFLKEGHSIDFINLSLGESLENLGKLTGEILSEEVLESIFSKFCIGK